MKTGYVYIVALNGRGLNRLSRILRLCVSLRHPEDRVARLAAGPWRGRAPKIVGYEFVEDLVGARAHVRAALKPFRFGVRGRNFLCPAPVARTALSAVAVRQSALRKGRFHPRTGLLTDREIELAGPITELTRHLSDVIASETHGDLAKIGVYLHPYTVGVIASVFHHTQSKTKIPDIYFPEILREIAWRSWKCRVKPDYFVAEGMRSKEAKKYLELARYRFEHALQGKIWREIPEAQLAAFLRHPNQHLRETVASYADELEHSPRLKARRVVFRIARFALALGAALLGQAMLAGGASGNWMLALLVMFLAGLMILAFNLYETPDLSKGIGFLTAREAREELARLRQKSDSRPPAARPADARACAALRVA